MLWSRVSLCEYDWSFLQIRAESWRDTLCPWGHAFAILHVAQSQQVPFPASLPPSSMQWPSLKPILDLSFWLLEGKAAHLDSSVLPFQQVRPHGWCQKNWIPFWNVAGLCLCFPVSPLLAESRQHLELGGCEHFSFSLCLLGPSGTAAFLISSLRIYQQWEIMNLSSVGGIWAVPWLNNWCK